MLFQKRHPHSQNSSAQKIIIINRPQPLPAFMKKLVLYCPAKHPVALPMVCIGTGHSDSGTPLAVYTCQFPGCACRQGWAVHHQTNKPFPLWIKPNG